MAASVAVVQWPSSLLRHFLRWRQTRASSDHASDYVEEPVLRRLATFEAASGTGWPTVATTSNSFQCPNERHQTCTRNCEGRDSARLTGSIEAAGPASLVTM